MAYAIAFFLGLSGRVFRYGSQVFKRSLIMPIKQIPDHCVRDGDEMKFVNLILCLVLASSAGLLAQSQSQKAKLSFDQAQKIALEKEPGKIESRELEKEHGKLIYSFDIRTANGLHEVNVDAMTGNVITDKIETAAEEAKEKQQDARKAKKKSQTAPQ